MGRQQQQQQQQRHHRRSKAAAAAEAAGGRGAVEAPMVGGAPETDESAAAASATPDPTPIPTGFRFGGGAGEMHGHPIYCVSWSTDLYRRGDGGGGGKGGGRGGVAAGDPPSRKEKDGGARDGDDDAPESAGVGVDDDEAGLVRCVATCGGDHVTVYEVTVDPTPGRPGSSAESIVARQAYVDADSGECFYACAFGGRGVDLDALRPPTTTSSSSEGEDGDGDDGGDDGDGGDDDEDGTGAAAGGEEDSAAEGGGAHRRSKRQRRRPSRGDDDDGPSPPPPTSSTVVIDAAAAGRGRGKTSTPLERELRYYRRLADFASYDGPQLLCCAGKRGVVKVIDTTRRALVLTLRGHGDEIYDLKFNPANEWLLATASKDESLRLWNLRTATCVAIFAGENGHRESVLSLDFHPLGTALASSGMDNTVKLWSLDGDGMRRSIGDSFEQGPRREGRRLRRHLRGKGNLVFRTRYEQMPYFSTKKMHTDYVDCVQFVGDLILSKSIANVVVLWKPDVDAVDGGAGGRGGGAGGGACGSRVLALREFQLNQCSTWFVRFHADVTGRMLAVGNNVGEVKVWEIGTSPHRKHFANLTHPHCGSTVRMVSFSPDGRSLIAVCEDASVWKWDAV